MNERFQEEIKKIQEEKQSEILSLKAEINGMSLRREQELQELISSLREENEKMKQFIEKKGEASGSSAAGRSQRFAPSEKYFSTLPLQKLLSMQAQIADAISQKNTSK